MGRSPCCDKANVKKGPWSPEEDAMLKEYIEKNGTGGNWISLPQKAGLKRCGKSCRLRWLNYLRPNIKHGEFSDDEDRLIYSLFANIGSRWSIIAAQLPGRTDNDIKNYWNTKLKKKLMGLIPNPSHKLPINNPLNDPLSSYSSSLSSSSYSSPTPSSINYLHASDPPRSHNSGALCPELSYHQFSMFQNPFNFSITKGQGGYEGPMGNYQVKEGVPVSSCSSSDDGGYLLNGVDDNQNLIIPDGLCGEDASDYSCLEEIKQLISTNFCNNVNFFVDHDNKVGEKVSYF